MKIMFWRKLLINLNYMNEHSNTPQPTMNSKMHIAGWLVLPLLWLLLVNYVWIKEVVLSSGWMILSEDEQVLGASVEPVRTPLPEFNWEKTGLVTFWFDDAWLSQYEVGFPILERFDMPGTIAVPTHLVSYDAYMNWNQIQRLQFNGWETTSHTRTHICTWGLVDSETMYQEVKMSQVDLWKKGLRADHFVAPCGVDESLMEMVRETYSSSRTVAPGLNPLPVVDPYHLRAHTLRSTTTIDDFNSWIKQAKNERSWLILMFHQIDDSEAEFSVKPDVFYEMVQAVSKSELPVVLPTQALSVK